MKGYIGLAYSLQIGATLTDACSRDWNLTRVDDLFQIKHCVSLTGALAFEFGDPVSIELPSLVEAGDLTIRGHGVKGIKFCSLRSVGRFSVGDTSELAEVYMPMLKSAISLTISNCGKLLGLDFPSGLRTVGDLQVKNTSIESFRGIDAKIVVSIAIEDNPRLLEMPLPKLLKVKKSLSIQAPNKEFIFNAPVLKKVNGNLTFKKGSRIDVPKLQSIRGNLHFSYLKTLEITLPISEVTGSIIVNACTHLVLLNLPQLVFSGRLLHVHENNALASIRLRSLKAAKELRVHAPYMRDVHLNRELTASLKVTLLAKINCKRIYKIFGLQLGHFVCVSTIEPNDANGVFISLF